MSWALYVTVMLLQMMSVLAAETPCVPVYLLQVMLFEEAPFEVVYTATVQPVKSKSAKETKAKNISFVPVPDSGKLLRCLCIVFSG